MTKPMMPVGVSVLLVNGKGQIALGKRLAKKANGLLSTPGGRIEQNENLFQCASREVFEETGAVIALDKFHVLGFREHFRFEDHYIMIYVTARFDGELQNTEPEKCAGWTWYWYRDIPLERTTEPQEFLEAALRAGMASIFSQDASTDRAFL